MVEALVWAVKPLSGFVAAILADSNARVSSSSSRSRIRRSRRFFFSVDFVEKRLFILRCQLMDSPSNHYGLSGLRSENNYFCRNQKQRQPRFQGSRSKVSR